MTLPQFDALADKVGDTSAPAAEKAVAKACAALIPTAEGTGLAGHVAALYRDGPLHAEGVVRDAVLAVARSTPGDAFERLDDFGPSLEADGRTHRRAAATPGCAMTAFGPVDFMRPRHRPAGTGASLVPAEGVPGLVSGGMTPMAAGLPMALMSDLTARGSEDAWRRIRGQGPSAASPVRLTAAAGKCAEGHSGDLSAELCRQEGVPAEAASVIISPDGVFMRMNDRAGDGKGAGWREASCGVVALVDAGGETLESRCLGRLPEAGKESLKARTSGQPLSCLSQGPDLKAVAVADGAPDNWSYLDPPTPDAALIDFRHSAQHLKAAADAAFGPGTEAGTAWFEKQRHVPRHDPKGVGKVIDALRHLLRKGGKGAGAVESANKALVTTRMKRSGQRWARGGGQGVLAFRSLLRSGRFDRAWRFLAPRPSRSRQPENSANDDRPVTQIALAA